MDWERFDRIANRAQFPFTVGGYVGWAYALWPKGAVLVGSPKNMSWMAIAAIGVLSLGALSTASQLGWLRAHKGQFSSERIPPDAALPHIAEVVNQTFKNQEVFLDGHAYFACTFENCSFVYDFGPTGGFGPNCKFGGSRGIKGNDPRLQHLLHFLESLGLLNPFLKPVYTPKSAALVSEGSVEDEAQREIHMVLNNRDHPYWDANKAGHAEALERMQKLYQIAYPDKSPPTPAR
jgi:hypothetical protein